VHSAAARRTSHGTLRNYAEPKPFSCVKPVHVVGFSSSIFTVQDHVLSTPGDACRASHLGPQASPLWHNVLTAGPSSL